MTPAAMFLPPPPLATGRSGRNVSPGPLHQPVKTTLVITESCNLDCRLCYGDCKQSKPRVELGFDVWLRVLDELAANGVIWLYIEGGEPFLKPGFVDLLAGNASRFFLMVRTNGTLVDRALAERLREIDVGIVLVDLWGAKATTHDALTGTSGSFERTLQGISELLRAGVETQTLFILNRFNVHELRAYTELVHGLGVRTAGILRLYPLGRAKRHWTELALSLPEMTRALDDLQPPEGLRIMQSWHPRNANCCWQMSAINPYGDSIGCAYLREYVHFGNVTETPFLNTWNHPMARQLRIGKVERSCGSCASSQGSHGGCRSTAFAFRGNFDAPDPFDVELNDGIDLKILPERCGTAAG
jgi:radical SAM protein with 4Fe4S-binding SPASM domain